MNEKLYRTKIFKKMSEAGRNLSIKTMIISGHVSPSKI